MRLAVFTFSLQGAMWILGGHHAKGAPEGWLLIEAFCNAAGMGLGFWILYMALEPFARRRWPEMLISWTRAISGSWRDPLVGRDILIGAAAGTATEPSPGPDPGSASDEARHPRADAPRLRRRGAGQPGPRRGVAHLDPVEYSTFWVLGIVFLLVLTRALVRSGWLAGVVVTLISATTISRGPGQAISFGSPSCRSASSSP